MKQLIRPVVNFCFEKLGGLAFAKFLNRDKITVLMLHSVMEVSDDVEWSPLRRYVKPSDLEQLFCILEKHYSFISLSHAMDILQGRATPVPNALVVTFDDGYHNNLSHGLPILKRFSVVPTIFVATGHVDRREAFWVDRIDYALQQLPAPEYVVNFAGTFYRFDTSNRDALKVSYRYFLQRCKYAIDNDIETLAELSKLADLLEQASGKSLLNFNNQDHWSGVTNWDALSDAVTRGDIEVGSHTVDHVRVSRVEQRRVMRELQYSKERLEQKLPVQSKVFCYPNGDFDQFSRSAVISSGYRGAVTTLPGLCKQGDDLFTLKRFACPKPDTEAAILLELSGFKQIISGWR